jgi:hypothetical protein
MSLAIIKSQINSFLNSETPEVMAIRGKWGVGKTYFWKQILGEAQEKNHIKLDKYAYVSLFGINCLEAMKFSMFEQVVDKKLIGKEASVETFKSNAEKLLKSLGRKSVHIFQGIPVVKNFGSAINSISFLSLQKVLLCIDDFERKGDNLSAKDVLGLVTILKEQKKCKVVLILNDESFEDKARDDYKIFREKCIDIELEFSPSASDCSSIAITGQDRVSEKLKELIEKLGINNIRIIKKIERVGRLLEKALSKFEIEVLNQALHSLSLFSWCYYTINDISPDFNYVKNIGNRMFDIFDDSKEESDEEKQWKAILREFGYQTTDEFDLQIAKIVETGFVNEQEILSPAEQLNNQILATKSESTLHDAWRIYHDSFGDDEDLLVDSIRQSILKHAQYISPSGLNASVRLLRDLDRNELADELVDHYVAVRKDEKQLFDLSNYPFREDISDAKINAEFQKISNEVKKTITLKEVLEKIAGKNGWGGEDERVLAGATPDEYYELFKNEKGEHLSIYIDKCLQFGRFVNAPETGKTIAANATTALERIGRESCLNARRVSKFGVKIPNE